jgi:acetyl-CoA carboxylase biotin carboxyl carrier protein
LPIDGSLEGEQFMTDDVSDNSAAFDLDRLQTLIEMMEKHGLTEVSLRRGEEHWRLRRGPQEIVQSVPAAMYSAQPPAAQAAASSPAAGDESQADGTVNITSPTVGTFYSSPNPEDPAFVSVGTKVDAETIVCMVEAMKVFNEIKAEVDGTVEKILVKNEQAVEYGQPMFLVRPR